MVLNKNTRVAEVAGMVLNSTQIVEYEPELWELIWLSVWLHKICWM